MRMKPAFLLIALFACFPSTLPASDSEALTFHSSFENGRLYRAGEIRVVELKGDYRQMGRQYGSLLKEDLLALNRTIEEVFIKKMKMSPKRMAAIAGAVYDRYPQRYKEILHGMAETSGLGRDGIILLNAVEWFPKINHLFYGRCSGAAAWGPYSRDGDVVFGRNNDDDIIYREFARHMVVAVFKPGDGSIPTALVNYAGVIYNATGINAEGLFIELNSGPWMGFSLERTSIFTTLFSYLQEYRDIPQLDRAMRSTLVDISAIINVADKKRACSYECSLWDTRRRDQDDGGFLAAANAFLLPGWNLSSLDPTIEPDKSRRRQRNLVALGARHKGTFTPEVMMKVLDVPLEKGGATVPETIYQVVAAPKDLKMWIKVPGFEEWREIPLGPLFGK